MAEDLHKLVTYKILDDVLEDLEKLNFLVRTGKDYDVFFAKDPLLAHTLGVAIETPNKVGITSDYFWRGAYQLLLPFTSEKDPTHYRG